MVGTGKLMVGHGPYSRARSDYATAMYMHEQWYISSVAIATAGIHDHFACRQKRVTSHVT